MADVIFTILVSRLVICGFHTQLLPHRLQRLTGDLARVGLQVRQHVVVSTGQHKAVAENYKTGNKLLGCVIDCIVKS